MNASNTAISKAAGLRHRLRTIRSPVRLRRAGDVRTHACGWRAAKYRNVGEAPGTTLGESGRRILSSHQRINGLAGLAESPAMPLDAGYHFRLPRARKGHSHVTGTSVQ